MMLCRYCGEELEEGYIVCPKCGKRVPGRSPVVNPPANTGRFYNVITIINMGLAIIFGTICIVFGSEPNRSSGYIFHLDPLTVKLFGAVFLCASLCVSVFCHRLISAPAVRVINIVSMSLALALLIALLVLSVTV